MQLKITTAAVLLALVGSSFGHRSAKLMRRDEGNSVQGNNSNPSDESSEDNFYGEKTEVLVGFQVPIAPGTRTLPEGQKEDSSDLLTSNPWVGVCKFNRDSSKFEMDQSYYLFLKDLEHSNDPSNPWKVKALGFNVFLASVDVEGGKPFGPEDEKWWKANSCDMCAKAGGISPPACSGVSEDTPTKRNENNHYGGNGAYQNGAYRNGVYQNGGKTII